MKVLFVLGAFLTLTLAAANYNEEVMDAAAVYCSDYKGIVHRPGETFISEDGPTCLCTPVGLAQCATEIAQAGYNACQLPPETGFCRAAFKRFYYDADQRDCKPFIYGGCGGNGNNFRTYMECVGQCKQ